MPEPWEHPTTKVFYARRAVPKDLWPTYGSKRELKVSLRTRDPAAAVQPFQDTWSRWNQEFTAARKRQAESTKQSLLFHVRKWIEHIAESNNYSVFQALEIMGSELAYTQYET